MLERPRSILTTRDSGAIHALVNKKMETGKRVSTSNDQGLDDLAYHTIDSLLSANQERHPWRRRFQRNSRFAFLDAKIAQDFRRRVWIERVE